MSAQQLLVGLGPSRRLVVDALLVQHRPLSTLELEQATGVERSLLLVTIGWLYAAGIVRVVEHWETADVLRFGWEIVPASEAAA